MKSSSSELAANKNEENVSQVSTSPEREHLFWGGEDDPDLDPDEDHNDGLSSSSSASRSASCSPSTCSESSSESCCSPLQHLEKNNPPSISGRSSVALSAYYERLCQSEEHSNSSDSAAFFSDDDVTTLKRNATLVSTSLPMQSSPPQKMRSSLSPKTRTKETPPGRLGDFRRLSLKRKPKNETTPCKLMNIR